MLLEILIIVGVLGSLIFYGVWKYNKWWESNEVLSKKLEKLLEKDNVNLSKALDLLVPLEARDHSCEPEEISTEIHSKGFEDNPEDYVLQKSCCKLCQREIFRVSLVEFESWKPYSLLKEEPENENKNP